MKKFAVGTSDGKVVNAHFGRTPMFLIYDISKESIEKIEVRENEPGCSNLNEPKGTMENTITLIGDCDYVVVSQIGKPMVQRLEQSGIRALVIRDFIDDALIEMQKYVSVNLL